MHNPQQKAMAAAELHAQLLRLREVSNIAAGRGLVAPGRDVPRAIDTMASEFRTPRSSVASHVSELIRTGQAPRDVSLASEYGQRLLRLAEDVVGPRVASVDAPTSLTPAISQVGEHTPESLVRASAGANTEALDRLHALTNTIAGTRAKSPGIDPNGPRPHLLAGRELAADARNLPGTVTRRNEVGTGVGRTVVSETPMGERNLVIHGVARGETYDAIAARARSIGERVFGGSRENVNVRMAEAMLEFFRTGRTPSELTGKTGQQRRDARFFAQFARLVLTSETMRSPTNLPNVEQVLRAIAAGRPGFELEAISRGYPAGLAARRGDPAQNITPRAGGSSATRRALVLAEHPGGPSGHNALERGANEVLDRHRLLADADPEIRAARDETHLRQIFLRRIEAMLGGW
jgi:hypothetical protein